MKLCMILNACGSLGPGSAVGEKGKKRGQIGQISASEASPAVAWGDYLSEPFFFFFAYAAFFSFFPQCGVWSLATRAVVNNPF